MTAYAQVTDFLSFFIKNHAEVTRPVSGYQNNKLKSCRFSPISVLGIIIKCHFFQLDAIAFNLINLALGNSSALLIVFLFRSLERSPHFQNQIFESGLPAYNQELKWSFAWYRVGNRFPFQYDQSFERSLLPSEPAQPCSSFLLHGFSGRNWFWPR